MGFDFKLELKGCSNSMRSPNTAIYAMILRCIKDENVTLPKIAELCKISKSNLSFYLGKMVERGLLRIMVEKPRHYHLTELGGQELSKLELDLKGSQQTLTTFLPDLSDKAYHDNLHNLSFKYEIIKHGDLMWLPNEKQLQNMIERWGHIGGVKVSLFGKRENPSSMEIRFRLEDRDSHRAMTRAWEIAMNLGKRVMKEYSMILDYPVCNRRPHFTIKGDPDVERIAERMTVYVPGIGHIDRSHDEGELEYYTAEYAKERILMPIRTKELQDGVQRIEGKLDALVNAIGGFTDKVTETLNTVKGKSPTEKEEYKPSIPDTREGYR